MRRNPKLNLVEVILFVLVTGLLTAGAYSRNRLWNDELELWRDNVRKAPGKARPYVNLGYAYLVSGDYERAFDTTLKAVQIDPAFATAYYNLGILYEKRGELQQAIAMAKKSLRLDPDLFMVYYTLGGFYLEDKQYDQAETCYEKFIQIYPYFPDVHNLLAAAYISQKRFDKVVEALEAEVKVNPYHSLAHLNLGQVYWHEFKNREKALYHLRVALALDPFLPDRDKIMELTRMIGESSS